MNPQDSQSDAEKIVNEILRRHDHQQDAHELDVSLIEALITKRETLARIDELTKMDGKLGVFYSPYEKFKNDSHDSKLLFKLRTNQLQQRLEKGLDTNHE